MNSNQIDVDAKNLRKSRIELGVGYAVIISMFFIVPSLWVLWLLSMFGYFYFIYRVSGPQEPDMIYAFRFKALGGSGNFTKYINAASNVITLLYFITSVLLAVIIYNLSTLLLINKAFVFYITGATFAFSCWFFRIYYERKIGLKLHKFFANKFLIKLWKKHVGDYKFNTEEKELLRKIITDTEMLPGFLDTSVRNSLHGKVFIKNTSNKILIDNLLSKKIIGYIKIDGEGGYYLSRWATDYIKLHPEILN